MAGLMWGAAKIVVQLLDGDERRVTKPVVLLVGRGRHERMVLVWVGGRGDIVKERGKTCREVLR